MSGTLALAAVAHDFADAHHLTVAVLDHRRLVRPHALRVATAADLAVVELQLGESIANSAEAAGALVGGDGSMASSAESLSVSVMGARILVTAAKSMGGGGSVTSLPRNSVAGVALGTDGAPDVEQYDVTLVMVEVAMAAPCEPLRGQRGG
jgi:hypothetical protein